MNQNNNLKNNSMSQPLNLSHQHLNGKIIPLFIIYNNTVKNEAAVVFRLLLSNFKIEYQKTIRLIEPDGINELNDYLNSDIKIDNPYKADLELKVIWGKYEFNRYFLFRKKNSYIVRNPAYLRMIRIDLLSIS